MHTLHRFTASLLVLLALACPAWAEQISNWRSSSGNSVQMIGTQNMAFTVVVTAPDGRQSVGQGNWVSIQIPKSFTLVYPDGRTYFCKYVDDYTIGVTSRTDGQVSHWSFVNWVSR